jgi:CubicO group peptidase (beta-lactamase class C family)
VTQPSDVVDLSPLLADWPVKEVAVGVTDATSTLAIGGDTGLRTRIASISKLLTTVAGLVAAEEETISLDEPAGPQGSTVRHLLAHASGLPFEGSAPVAPPGRRRIYSNTGIEVFARHLEAKSDMPFADYLTSSIVEPLGLGSTGVTGSPARGFHSVVTDLLAFARELLAPRLISPVTLKLATTTQFPGLKGVLPGIGAFDPNDWGLGFEIRDGKDPHWTGSLNSPATFGHFGGSGTFLWVDPSVGLACTGLTDRQYGPWALEAWPRLSDEILRRFAGSGG